MGLAMGASYQQLLDTFLTALDQARNDHTFSNAAEDRFSAIEKTLQALLVALSEDSPPTQPPGAA